MDELESLRARVRELEELLRLERAEAQRLRALLESRSETVEGWDTPLDPELGGRI